MRYHLSKASMLKRRDWQFITLRDVNLPEKEGRYIIEGKNIPEICKFAVHYLHLQVFDLLVCIVSPTKRIYVDGYISDDGQAHISISLSIGSRVKHSREYYIGNYGGGFDSKEKLGDQYYYGRGKAKTLGSNYPL